MNWRALKDYKCPSSGHAMQKARGGHECSTAPECKFYIGDTKLDALMPKLNKPTRAYYKSEDTNLSNLNNYGRDAVSKDFRDSPHLN